MCLALVLAFGLFATPASAQTVKAFQIERQLILPFLLTTIMPNPKLVDPAILAAVAAGQLEIRERLAYDPVGQTIASTTFLVFAGSPLPTPPAVDVSHQTIAYFVLVVGDPVFSTQPFPSVLFTGTIADNPGGTPFGDYHGAASFVSFGYTKDTPTKLNNVLCVIAGATIAYSPSAAGSVVIQ
jgi:hypothetical protein